MKWERTVRRATRRSGRTNDTGIAYKKTLAAVLFFMGLGTVSNFIYADVTVAPGVQNGYLDKTTNAGGGTTYDIGNQQVNNGSALNKFTDFTISNKDIANLQLDKGADAADRQINIVQNKIDINGVVNSFKNGNIGGDVYFFSSQGIAVGKTGVFNVGRLTLGTNPAFGQDLYNGNLSAEEFAKKGSVEKAQFMNTYYSTIGSEWGNGPGEGTIDIKGKIYAGDGEVVIAAPEKITLDGAEIYGGVTFNAVEQNWTADNYRNSFVNLDNVEDASMAVKTDQGIALVTNDTMSLNQAKLYSYGRDIDLIMNSPSADLQADKNNPENGVISITESYIDSSSQNRDSGDISVQAIRDRMGVSKVEVKGTTIHAGGQGSRQAGDVTILATAQTQLYAWDIGDGAYATVNLGKKESTGKKNTITGDNVTVAAVASTVGQIGSDETGDTSDTTAPELAEKLGDSDSALLNALKDYGGNVRALASATDITAKSEVNIYDTDLSAVGGKKSAAEGETERHGVLDITSHAESRVAPITIGAVGYGVNVGISDLTSKVNTDRSNFYADKDVKIEATGENTVDMMLIELGLADKAVRSTVNFSWAELSSDVGVHVGEKAEIISGGNVDIKAESIRTLKSSVSNGSDANVIGAAVSVAIGDTNAEAHVAGDIYAAGDVTVAASNRVASTEGGALIGDTSKAASMSGDSFLKPVVEGAKDLGGSIVEKGKTVIEAVKTLAGKNTASDPSAEEAVKENDAGNSQQAWNKFGLNAATALLFSDNDANASVTGTVRGVEKNNGTGLYQKSPETGAKSLSVTADTLSRSTVRAVTYQQELTNKKDETQNQRKDTGVAISVTYAQQDNTANAWIGGDVKTKGDVVIHATNSMPWKTVWHTDSWVEVLKNIVLGGTDTALGVSDLFDSWSQAAGDGKNTSGSASVGIIEYENEANAYILGGATIDVGGELDVKALNDAVTVNISGALKDPLTKTPLGIIAGDVDFKSYFQNPLGGDTKNSIGGSALSVHQDNTARAYIADDATVSTRTDVNVRAENSAKNVTLTAAGGAAENTAVQGTVAVNRIDDTTEAYIGSGASVTSDNGDVNVEAEDSSSIVNVAGAVSISEDTSIGATIGYNHVDRVTSAYNKGKIEAKNGNVSIAADNTGLLVTASAAGSVTNDSKPDTPEVPEGTPSNAAGSEGLEELATAVLNVDAKKSSEVATIETGANVVDTVNSSGAVDAGKELSEKTDAAKSGFSLSANVGVNRILDTAKAYTSGGSVTAGSLGISSANDSDIVTVTAALSMHLGAGGAADPGGTAIAGTFMYNSITAENDAYVDGSALTLTGNTGKDADGNDIDESLTVKAENKEKITNIAASGSGSTKGSAIAGQIGINWIDNKTYAYVKDSTLQADEKTSITADNNAKLESGIGSVSVAAGGNGTAVGASVGVNLIESDTKAYMDSSGYSGTAEKSQGGDLTVTADDTSDIKSIVVGGGLADGFAGAFSANASVILTNTEAHVDTGKGIYSKALDITARNGATTTLGTGSAAVGNQAAGMAIGVNVSKNTVTSYLNGDSNKQKEINADSISVEAVNAFNKSASAETEDLDKEGTAKNIAVGAAAGAAQFGGSGSVTMNFITQTTDASIGKGLYTSGGAIDVNAVSSAKLFGLAGGVAVSGGTGIGAGIDTQVYDGHTYASIEDGAKISKAGDVTIKAESTEDMTSVGFAGGFGGEFAGAGAAGMHILSSDTKAYIGNETDTAIGETDKADISDAGKVTVRASDTTTLSTTSAGGAIGGTAAGGLSAAVEVVNKNVAAYIGNHAAIGATGLDVTAVNYGKSNNNAVGLAGGGAAGVAGSASETIVDYDTKAYVGDDAKVTIAGTDNAGASISADSDFIQIADAGAAGAGGGVGVGIANTTVKLTADTYAYIGKNADVSGGKKVDVKADHLTDITYATVAGAAAGSVAANGAVGVNYLTTNTWAYADTGAALMADGQGDEEGVSIKAADKTKLNGGTGGASVGGAGGGGAAVTVNVIDKNTKAYADKGASLDSKGKIAINAQNTENLYNWTVQGSGGASAGLAGAVTVTDINAVTMAYTNSGVLINQNDGYKDGGGDISVKAGHEIEQLFSTVTGAAGSGGASVGAAVDVATIKTQTNAYVGDGNKINTQGKLSVIAEDNMHDIKSVPVSAAIGTVGLAGSFSIYNFSSAADTSALGGNAGGDAGEISFNEWVNDKMAEAGKDTKTAIDAYDNAAAQKIKEKLPDAFDSAPGTKGEAGTLAKIGESSVINAGGVTVDANDHIGMTTGMGNLAGGAASAGASVAILNSNTQVQAVIDKSARISTAGLLKVNAEANHTLDTIIVGAAVGGVAIQGTVQTWKDETKVYAKVGTDETDDTTQIEAGSIEVKADNDRTLRGTITGASAALLGAASGSVITADIGGESIASIGKVNMAAKSGDVTIASTADTDLDATAVAAAVGYYSGAGTGAVLSSHVNTASTIASGAKLSGGNLSITSVNTPKLSATAGAAAGGMAAVGATVAKVESEDNASVTVGDNVSLTADEKVTIKAETARPEKGDNLYAKAIAGSGGVIAGAVSTTGVILNQETSVTIGENNTIEANKLDILAKHEDATNFRNESVAAGGVSGTGAETKTDIDSTVKVSIGAGTQINTKNETAVKALNRTLKGNYDGSNSTKTVYSGGASLANGNGIVNDTDIDHITKVDIGDGVKIQAAASALTEDEKTAGKTLADKNAIAIDAQSDITAKDYYVIGTGAAIGAAHIKNTMDVTADTDVAVGTGAEFLAGDTAAASKSDYTDKPSATETHFGQDVGGGSIAVASKNTADLESKTLVDIFGAAGYAGGSNDVTYDSHADTAIGGSTKLETANGDIRLAAGRDSDGNIGTVSVKAISNILNATAIPVSVVKDPHAKATHDVKITVNEGAELLSDRDIYLQSRAMEEDVQVSGSGEIKDWTRKVGEIFGASSSIGKTTRDYTAQVEFNGKAETGIHRNQSITIGGKNENGTWKTEIKRTGGISYDFTTNVEVGKALLERLDELRDLKAKYSSDAAAVAAYDAEISFLEEKLVANGLGVFETDDKGNRTFVEFDLETKSDFEIADNEIKNLDKKVTVGNEEMTQYELNLKILKEAGQESKDRVDKMGKLQTLNESWTKAETAAGETAKLRDDAQIVLDDANKAYTAAETAANAAYAAWDADRDNIDLKTKYETAKLNMENALESQKAAQSSYDAAKGDADKANQKAAAEKLALTDAVTDFDKQYGTKYGETDPENAAAVADEFNKSLKEYESLSGTIQASIEKAENSYTTLKDSIAASNHFHEVGTENEDGTFSYDGKDGTLTQNEKTDIYTWTYTDSEGKERSGVLLHTNSYGLTTSKIQLGDIEARLGDIVGEGQEIYGSGSLLAHGDAKVTITNNSPNNITTGDIQIKGGSSVVTSEDGETAINKVGGGTITWNGQAMHSKVDLTNQNDSKKDKNAETKYEFTGSVTTKQDATGEKAPSVTIESTFNPKDKENLLNGKIAYAAPTIQVGTAGGENIVYNPGGSVTVKSAYGDIYNNATVNAGGVSIEATNGDFVQSYVNRITSVSGNPNDDSKETGVGTGSGILANGNIFISARYVNINGTIQSGIAEWNVEIPAEPKLYYKDGDTKVPVSIADAAKYKDKTLYVEGASGNGADYVTYDPDSKRFLLSGIEVNGGTVDIVGTIMNTARDGAKVGKILALDGYGSITVKNNSNIDLELGNLSTGSGVEGKITITDLDLKTGEKKNTVTYTRKDGVVYKDGDAQTGDVVYKPSDGIYYVWQTGQDSTIVTSYHHRSREFNIFGSWGDIGKLIENSEVTDVKKTNQYDIDPDGTFVGDAAAAHRGDANVNDYYQSSEETYTTSTSEAYDKKTKTKRLWYSLGTVKQYDTYFKVKTGTTTITTNSIKANQEIGIGFVGNEAGGSLSVDGGTANVYVGGVITNQGGSKGGSTDITAGSIQQGDYGFIHTDALTLTATEGSVGGEKVNDGKISVNNAIQTDAEKLSGSAEGSFSVIVTDHGVNLGSISAGNTVSISAGGNIIQNADAKDLSANRVVLNTGNGKIAGENDDAFRIAVGQPGENANEENYGLKANASGDISFENTSGDLYVDSVISSAGNVTISTNGSFIDNNFTDVDDATAQEKLLAWAEAAVLEGGIDGVDSTATVTKQKDMLKAQVDSDYAQWKILSGQVDENGTFVLTDEMRSQLKESGVDEAGIAAYVDARQAAYDKLKAQGVAQWTDDQVAGFKGEIDSAEGIYGRANLTEAELAGKFTFLNADDVANTLVGSAKSAEQLLIGFAPGGIKDGITDTNITIKGTPHVSGKNVTLNTTADGSIGSKVTAADIDLSQEGWYNSLSKADLLALSTAEQGDFQYADNKITVSTVKGIDVEAAGAVNAITQNGSIYLVSEGAMNLGTIEANGGELRIKASGNLTGGDTAISAGGNIVLESGSGEISSIVLDKDGTGILTARAKDGVSISKAGDLVINTVYAAEGDVTLDVSDGEDTHDILASDGTDDANKGNDKNIKGQNITLLGVDNLGTEVEGETKSLGIEVTDVTDENGTITGPGKFTAHIKGDGDITVYGEMGDADFSTAKDLRLHNEGLISGGKYKVEGKLTLWNNGTGSESIGEDGSMSGITGGEFDANHVQLENHAAIASGHFTANESYTVNNHKDGSFVKTEKDGETIQATVESQTVTVNNWGTVSGGIFHATGKRGENGKGNVTYTAYKNAKTEGGTLISDKADVNIKANDGDVTFDKIQAVNGSANISDVGNLSITDVHVGGRYDVVTSGDAEFETVKAGAVTITAGGNVSGTTLTTTAGNAGLKAGQDISIGTISSAESITGTAGGTLTSESIKANENVTLNSAGDMSIKDLETKNGKAELASKAGEVDLMTSKIGDALNVTAKGNITVTTSESVSLTMNAGGSILAKGEGEGAKISSGNITLAAGENITISDRTGGVQKLEGVDTDGQPGNVTGVGTAASLVNGESAGNPFDTSTTGSAVISSSTGTITMEAGKTVSADHVVLGKEGTVLDKGGTLNINANVAGIDSLESHGTDKVTVTVKGNNKPAYHVGIHSGTDAPVTVKDSYIQHLDLTGKDNIGIENTAISGDSRLETDKIFVDIRDNPGNSQAQGFGHITLSGYDISSGGHFTDIHDGITINGATRPVTAMSVMNRSLYGLDYAGKDAEEKAREESTDANVEILFAEVMSYEKYHSIRM